MGLSCYLAITAEELAQCARPPARMAWMACQFSLYGTGITHLPDTLPAGSMLILNDRVSVRNHDPEQIRQQLARAAEELTVEAVLLDLQEPPTPRAEQIVTALGEGLPCPVGVTENYAHCTDGPVFLSSPPLDMPLADHAAVWKGRELWLEAAPETAQITVTADRAQYTVCPLPGEPAFRDASLCCGYRLCVTENSLTARLWRQPEDVKSLLAQAEAMGFTRAVGLYQQLCDWEL